jgi:hypothetical protein
MVAFRKNVATRRPLPFSYSSADLYRLGRQILRNSPAVIAQFPLEWISKDEANVPSADYLLCAGRLEIRKPTQRGRFQELEMRYRRGQFLEATLTV